MNTSKMYRGVPGLLAGCTLVVSSLIFFSGCEKLRDLCMQQLAQEYREFPAIVLVTRSGDNTQNAFHRIVKDSTGAESVEADFDLNKWTIAEVSLKTISEKAKAKEWKLNVYDYDSGMRIPDGRTGKDDDFQSIDKPTQLKNLPLDQLLTAEILFRHGEGPNAEVAEPVTIVFLFKKGKEIVKPAV
jgi:hypothetical protein